MIVSASHEDIPEICFFMDSVFGENPKGAETFSKWISSENFLVLLTRDSKNQICGIGTVCLKTTSSPENYRSFGEKAVAFSSQPMLGICLNLAVALEHRGKGLGQQITSRMMPWLLEKGCTGLYGMSWQKGSSENSAPLFEKLGFKNLGESTEFLREQSRLQGFTCKVCAGECQCRSIFYGCTIGELNLKARDFAQDA